MSIHFGSRRWLAIVALLLAACGGGGASVDDVPHLPTSGHGSLTVTGSGAGGFGGSFVPTSLLPAQPIGPVCNGLGCGSSLAFTWYESSGEGLLVSFISAGLTAPGAAPGTAVNDIIVTYSGATTFAKQCGVLETQSICTLASLGVTLNTAQRTVTFLNTTLPPDAGGASEVVLNGTISY